VIDQNSRGARQAHGQIDMAGGGGERLEVHAPLAVTDAFAI
jgi:hypothetical protein